MSAHDHAATLPADSPHRSPRAIALQAIGLSATVGERHARRTVFKGIDIALAHGRWASIVGPNGAGKSTLLKALAGVLPASGQVRLLGCALSDLSLRERARTLAWLAQSGAGDSGADDLSAYDVAMLGRLPHQGWLAPPGPADHAAVQRALRQTQAWDWRDRALGSLSGGERQRVLLARMLAVEAEVMLMDEPLANLDPPHQADWIALVRELVAQGRTVVSVLHELTLALMADDLVIVEQGQIRFAGACTDPRAHRALEAVFEQRIGIHLHEGRAIALPR